MSFFEKKIGTFASKHEKVTCQFWANFNYLFGSCTSQIEKSAKKWGRTGAVFLSPAWKVFLFSEKWKKIKKVWAAYENISSKKHGAVGPEFFSMDVGHREKIKVFLFKNFSWLPWSATRWFWNHREHIIRYVRNSPQLFAKTPPYKQHKTQQKNRAIQWKRFLSLNIL